MLRTHKKLSVDDEPVKAKGLGINYTFNRNSKLNELLIKGTVEAGLLERGKAATLTTTTGFSGQGNETLHGPTRM